MSKRSQSKGDEPIGSRNTARRVSHDPPGSSPDNRQKMLPRPIGVRTIQRNPYVFEEDAAVADALLEQEGPRGSTTEVSTGVSNTAEQSSVQGRPDVSEAASASSSIRRLKATSFEPAPKNERTRLVGDWNGFIHFEHCTILLQQDVITGFQCCDCVDFSEVIHGMELHGDWPPKGSKSSRLAHANGVCQYMQSLSMEYFLCCPNCMVKKRKMWLG